MNVNAILDAGAAVAAAAAESKAGKTGTDFSDYMSSLNGKSYGDYLEQIFQKASDTYNVSKDLLKAMAKAESDFKSDITSHAGAMGIMQLMPSTAASLGVTDAFDPEQNIMGGAKYLKENLERFNGDASLALAAYNAGPNAVEKYNGIPPYSETQNYVKTVLSYMDDSSLSANRTVNTGTTDTGLNSAYINQGTGLSNLSSYSLSGLGMGGWGSFGISQDGESITMDKATFVNMIQLMRIQMMINMDNQIGALTL